MDMVLIQDQRHCPQCLHGLESREFKLVHLHYGGDPPTIRYTCPHCHVTLSIEEHEIIYYTIEIIHENT